MGVTSLLPINENARLIRIPKLLQSPLHEFVNSSNVNRAVKENQRTALVMVKLTLKLVLCLTEIVIPLGGEELEHTALDYSHVVLLELVEACQALMEFFVADYSCQGYVITSYLHF